MKVGLFIDTFYPMVDGVIKVVDNYAKRLAKMCDVTVYCPDYLHYKRSEDLKSFGYKVVRCGSFPLKMIDYTLPTPLLDPKFLAHLAGSKLDIVHIHSPFTVGMAGMNYAKLHNIPLVATLHSQYKQDISRMLHNRQMISLAMFSLISVFNAADECWAVNEDIKELYVGDYGLTAPCRVQLNATDHLPVTDTVAAANEINERYGISPDEYLFLFTGRLNYLKNIDMIVRALSKVKSEGVRFKMLFVGDGQDRERLEELIRSLDLENDVVLCGLIRERETLEKIYSRADLFLFPSLYDANSLVQIEAACQGTATLFLRGARTASMVTEDVNGFISEPDEESYARKIVEIVSSPDSLRKVSEGARRDLYRSWDEVVDSVFADYERILSARKA